MKIDHIAVYTNNLEKLKQFYETYFKAQANPKYHNKNTGLETYFLRFEDNAKLEIMTRPNIEEKNNNPIQLGYIHLAFRVGTKENVDSLTGLLERDEYTIMSKPRTTGDGHYESCVLDPDGNQIEIVA